MHFFWLCSISLLYSALLSLYTSRVCCMSVWWTPLASPPTWPGHFIVHTPQPYKQWNGSCAHIVCVANSCLYHHTGDPNVTVDGWKPCGDYRALNAMTVSDQYPVRHIADSAQLAGRKVFTPVCINAPNQFISLLNSCPLIFGLMSFGRFAFFSGEYHFWFTPTFSQTQLGHKTRILMKVRYVPFVWN